MKNCGFYPKLAWIGIRKNARMYMPYILTCIGMVMMYYIILFLTGSSALKSMHGGDTMQEILRFGEKVIAVFVVVFLFYTNSFLIRRRKKEFGLYNILGMGKKNLIFVLIWEMLMIAGISLVIGLLFGVAFSKLAELAVVNLLDKEVSFAMTISLKSILKTIGLFLLIFLVILFHALRQIQMANPIELLHSEQTGEQPPKANWVFAAAGVVILCAAYWIAVTIQDPLVALSLFFIAVILVIFATYLLFIAGSVALCRLLQKNKNYYYKTNHFVSVSSMTYRMKRNGAGLASICILCTVVLVMISSTVCLYVGEESVLRTRYPRDILVDVRLDEAGQAESDAVLEIEQIIEQTAEENEIEMKRNAHYWYTSFAAYMDQGQLITDLSGTDDSSEAFGNGKQFSDFWRVYVVSLEGYNSFAKEKETLKPGEVLLYTENDEYKENTIVLDDAISFTVKKQLSDITDLDQLNGGVTISMPAMYLICADYEQVIRQMKAAEGNAISSSWRYGFDTDASSEEQIQFRKAFEEKMILETEKTDGIRVETNVLEEKKTDFYGIFGSLFFLGIFLGIVFLFAVVLIMYYKQISEGYEDQSRFEIMQKVGMTKKEIRKSINSQVLLVFFLPLLVAGMHLSFAFPMVSKMLLLFGLNNTRFLIVVTMICYLVFALFYVIVYQITSRSYYHIVSGVKE